MIYVGLVLLIIGLILEVITFGWLGHIFFVIGVILLLVGLILAVIHRDPHGPVV